MKCKIKTAFLNRFDDVENNIDTPSEVFPIYMHSDINLKGAGESGPTITVLDPQNHAKAIVFENNLLKVLISFLHV